MSDEDNFSFCGSLSLFRLQTSIHSTTISFWRGGVASRKQSQLRAPLEVTIQHQQERDILTR